MGDLISRSELLKWIPFWGGDIESMLEYIKNIPTAYDVKKVVAELEEELELAEKEEKRCLMEHSQRYESAEQYALGISNALDVVRNGGKE